MRNWIVTEAISGEEINLEVINNNKDHLPDNKADVVMNLVSSDSSAFPVGCKDAVACDTKSKKSLGDRSSAKYYFEGTFSPLPHNILS